VQRHLGSYVLEWALSASYGVTIRRDFKVTSNVPFEDWTSVLSQRLTGALLDRLNLFRV